MRHVIRVNSLIFFLVLLLSTKVFGQASVTETVDLEEMIIGHDPIVDAIIKKRDHYRLHLIYSKAETLPDGTIRIKTGELGSERYFYPASTVKLPVALLTLEKLKKNDLSLDDYLVFTEDVPCGSNRFVENSQNQRLTFRQMLSEMMTVSDNVHYSALFHFLGAEDINASLRSKGYKDVNIYKAFNGCGWQCHYQSPACKVYREGKELFAQKGMETDTLNFLKCYIYDKAKLMGESHEVDREIVSGPYDFNYNLELPLSILHEMMISFYQEELVAPEKRWNLRESDQRFLVKIMTMPPRNLEGQEFKDQDRYPDNLFKFLLLGEAPQGLGKTVSKIGLSYGFTTETAYLDDGKGNGCFVTVSIYTNANKTVNDGIYEYDSLARPFLARLGRILLEASRN